MPPERMHGAQWRSFATCSVLFAAEKILFASRQGVDVPQMRGSQTPEACGP